MADLPTARMTLSPSDNVQYIAVCPDHLKRSGDLIGVSQPDSSNRVTWKFRCRQRVGKGKNKNMTDHIFAALPDRNAPRRVEDFEEWKEKQRRERVLKEERRRK